MEQKLKKIFLIAFSVILLDQLSKYIIRTTLELHERITVIPVAFDITFYQNTGAGFSILQNQTLALIFISIAVIGYILYSLDKIPDKQKALQVCVAFVLGGAVGNLIDRVFFGYVTDFIDFKVWPIFNVADSFLSIGVAGIIFLLWKHDK